MKRLHVFVTLSALRLSPAAIGREAKVVRYRHDHQGKIVFTWLGDLWTADETGHDGVSPLWPK